MRVTSIPYRPEQGYPLADLCVFIFVSWVVR